MATKKKQQLKRQPGQHPKPSNRQSYDPDAPLDIHHNQKVDYLTASEVAKLVTGAKQSRNPERDQLLIFMLFRHGYRESEAIMARRDWIDFNQAQLWVERLKGSMSRYHPIEGDELRMIRKYLRTRDDDLPWLFISERMQPLADRSVRVIVQNAAKAAGLRHVKPHDLRHSCGFYLQDTTGNQRLVQDYLGHVSAESTKRYSRLSGKAFQGLWR